MPLLELAFDSGETSLSVRRFTVDEAISTPFRITIVAASLRPDVDVNAIVGRSAAFRMATGLSLASGAGARQWTGVCSTMEQLRAVTPGRGESTYRLEIVPILWLLSQRRNTRIFQHLSAPDIVEKVLHEWRIEPMFRLDRRAYPKLEYRVQYGETDLDFISRMLEEAGIAYYFVDDARRGSMLVLSDAPEAADSRGVIVHEDEPTLDFNREYLTAARLAQDVRPGAYTVRDFDFRRPSFPVVGAARDPSPEGLYEQYLYQPGASLIETQDRTSTPHADDRGVARHDPGAATQIAQRRLDGLRAPQRRLAFETNVADLTPGTIFSMRGHPNDTLDGRRLLVLEQKIEGTPGTEWRLEGAAIFADHTYRPPLRTQKPRIFGVQSAIVVGPKGQEIHTDEFGRVRVQFAWDREGKLDDQSSCWMRVSHGSAGGSFGMIVLPRVGQEVLVGFLEGDPDQPIVVGRVFNATSPVPYKLPDQKTMTGLKGSSSPAGTGGFNEIRFDDVTGAEKLSMRAERDLEKLVQNDETETTGGNRDVTVKKDFTETIEGAAKIFTMGKRTIGVLKDHCKLVNGNEGEVTNGNRRIQVGQAFNLDIGGDHQTHVDRDRYVWVGGNYDVTLAQNYREIIHGSRTSVANYEYTLQAGARLTLKLEYEYPSLATVVLDRNKITLETKGKAKVVLDGPNITIDAPGEFTVKANKIVMTSTAEMNLIGNPIDLNPKT